MSPRRRPAGPGFGSTPPSSSSNATTMAPCDVELDGRNMDCWRPANIRRRSVDENSAEEILVHVRYTGVLPGGRVRHGRIVENRPTAAVLFEQEFSCRCIINFRKTVRFVLTDDSINLVSKSISSFNVTFLAESITLAQQGLDYRSNELRVIVS